ncbi:MAG: 1-deoxy-D-xylulose-5-phosphate synthase, partial [Bacteroidetes bacterium]|nr:1-deoxy-D-xylulose-5-phosphate synthase [Bacteroidota bacterium]
MQFEDIDSPLKLKKLNENQLTDYAAWLREFLIGKIAELGGHFAANLGVVELTVAIHYIFEAPVDKIIWDVGHQSYAHKILTERKKQFDTLRKLNGISGFPKMSESEFDAFGTAHSSTSISAALGYAHAAKIMDIDRQHIAIIGDGAMSAGQAFEALNNAGISNTNLTIIINDNHIGIDPSQGALSEYLDQLDYKTDNLFTDFGFQYFGPIDGHNLNELIEVFKHTKAINGPKVIHVRTLKGKGYAPAEAEQTKWHSTSKFDKLSGKGTGVVDNKAKYQDIFGRTLLEIAEKDKLVVAVTPAMISGSSLHFMQEKFPDRVFDVGIAEQHALTFSAGLAASGLKTFCCIYSTFLQRAYDQLIHDIALQNLPVILVIDRAGLVGEDGPTHHGAFDLAFLQTVPNLTILSPSDQDELRNAIYTAYQHNNGPIAIRFPRGKSSGPYVQSQIETDKKPKSVLAFQGRSKTLII